ncbi:MAG: hypothetical protein AAFU85_29680 [Planctomycetota bacterium]
MPIKISCQCGKALTVKDHFAGKAVKCPSCGQAIRVPGGQAGGQAGGQPTAPAAAPAAQAVGTVAAGNPLNDLFDEEGFGSGIAAVCSQCGAPMAADAVLCTKCGFNKATGEMIEGHLTPGLDISSGTLALQKAAADMKAADHMQKKMTEKAGMPWWMLGLILFVLGSATSIGVMAMMSANQVTGESNFNGMQTFLQLAGAACALIAIGAFLKLVASAFQVSRNTGLLSFTILYLFVLVFQKPKERIGPFLVLLVFAGAAGGLLAYSQQV